MKRAFRLGVRPAVVVACVAAVALAGATGTPARPAKAFAPGCWKGTGSFGSTGTAPGGVDVTISDGSLAFLLRAAATTVAGHMNTDAHGTASMSANGVSARGSLHVTGAFNLTGTPSHVVGKGKYTFAGSVTAGGIKLPIALRRPVTGPLTIDTASSAKVAGHWGSAKWTAKKIAGSCG